MSNTYSNITILCKNLPLRTNANEAIFGIDFQFFNINQVFKGIKLISPGFHIIHFAPDSSGIKQGLCFFAKEYSGGGVYVFDYDNESEEVELYLSNSETDAKLRLEYNAFLVPYLSLMDEGSFDSWNSYLSKHITESLLDKIIVVPEKSHSNKKIKEYRDAPCIKTWRVNTVMSSSEENQLLINEYNNYQDKIKSGSLGSDTSDKGDNQTENYYRKTNQPLSTLIDDWEPRFNFVPIELTITYRPNASDTQKTVDYFDKSWYFQNVLLSPSNALELSKNQSISQRLSYQSLYEFFGELEFAYLLVVVFGNCAAAMQYNNMLKMLSSSESLAFDTKFYSLGDEWDFLSLWFYQISKLPEEYLTDEDMISPKVLHESLLNFKELCCALEDVKLRRIVTSKLEEIETLAMKKFEVIKEAQEYSNDDNTSVDPFVSETRYSFDNDEDDEDAPVIVTGVDWNDV